MEERILMIPEDKELPTEEFLTSEQKKEIETLKPKPIIKTIDLETMTVTERIINE